MIRTLPSGFHNRHSSGVSFATTLSNRLVPFSSSAVRRRAGGAESPTIDREALERQLEKHITGEQADPLDRDGEEQGAEDACKDKSDTHVDKESTRASGRTSPILQRKLHAWPTYCEASGIGYNPGDLVGSTYSHHGD